MLAAFWAALALASPQEPLRLHPDNPRLLSFRGRPTLLITSAEHYGAVLNLDFDYAAYLKTLQADGLNHTRTWAGTYREVPGSFGITDNTLAPLPLRYAAPWARSDSPGYAHGGNKFDLTKWDPAFFDRLKDFLKTADQCGVVVELNLWCPNYDEALWKASPLHASNNVNGVGSCGRNETYTLRHPDLLEVQERTTRKLVRECNAFDNLYFEIANEPYFGGVTLEWQHRIVDIIVDEEKSLPKKHLISMNVANGRARVEKPHPAVSIFNFHYCVPPDVVALNRALGKPIGENETGFRGKDDVLYRTEGWEFILAGGAIYNNLDYSFTTKNATGTFLEYTSPGGGSPTLRRQLKILRDFMESFDFVRMAPAEGVVRSAGEGLRARALAESSRQVAVYVHVPLAAEEFSVRWTGRLDPLFSEPTTFTTTSDDGVRLWVNGRKVIDQWTDHGARDDSGTVDLKAGEKVELRMEYYQAGGGAAAKLAWSSPSQKRQIVPKARLFLPDGSGNGLKGEYFLDRELKSLKMTRTDGAVNFDWSGKSPFAREAGRERTSPLVLDLPAGAYRAEWVNPRTGAVDQSEEIDHAGGERTLNSPAFTEDVALRLRRK